MPLEGIEIHVTGEDADSQFMKALICGDPGTGKGNPLSTPVLAPSGWTTIGELNVGDEIISPAGGKTTVTHIFDRGVQPAFKVTFSDGAWVIADADHLWNVQTRKLHFEAPEKWQTISTGELHERGVRRPRSGNRKDQYLYWIPTVAPVQHDKVDHLPIDPYLLGVLLANGSFKDTSVVFTTNDDEIAHAARAGSAHIQIVDATTENSTAKRYRIKGFKQVLRDLGLDGLGSADKFVPDAYLTAHEEARRLLLAGLMDCDGSSGQGNRRAQFHTTSPHLRDAVVALVRSLGGICPSVAVDDRGEKPCFNVSIEMPENPFTLTRKAKHFRERTPWRAIESIEPVGRVETRCIKVDAEDELFVVRDYIVTHNTLFGSTWPDLFVISAEGGLLSLRERSIRYMKLESIDQLRTVVKGLRYVENHTDNFGGSVKTVLIDTIDEVSHMLAREIMAETAEEKRKKGQDTSKLHQNDYGTLKERMKAIVTAIRNLPMNVVFTCHLRSKQDGEDSPVRYWPALDGSFAEEIAGYVDIAGLLRTGVVSEIVDGKSVRRIRRYLQTFPEPPGYTFIKDRSGTLPQEFELNLTDDYERLAALVLGGTVVADQAEITGPATAPVLSADQTDEEILAEINQTPDTKEDAA